MDVTHMSTASSFAEHSGPVVRVACVGLGPIGHAAVDALTTVTSFETPPAKAGVKLVSPDNVEELVRLLHEEAKAI